MKNFLCRQKYLIVLLVWILPLMVGCDRADKTYQDRCYCPLDGVGLADTRDSTVTINRDEDTFSAGLDVGLPQEVLKYFRAQLAIGYENTDEESFLRSTVRKTSNAFPEISNLQTFRNDMYCATINLLCRDTTLSDQQLAEQKRRLLVELEAEISALMLARINGRSTLPTVAEGKPNTTASAVRRMQQVTVEAADLDHNLRARLEAALTQYCLNQGGCRAATVSIGHDLAIQPEPLSEYAQRLTGSTLTLSVNDGPCGLPSLPDLLPANHRISGAEAQLTRQLTQLLNDYVEQHFAALLAQLQQCL